MSDTYYLPVTQRMILILYWATKIYVRSSVQSTVRFLMPRVPLCKFEVKMPLEWSSARRWWECELQPEEKSALQTQFKFAAKLR